MTWSEQINRRSKQGLRLVPDMGKRAEILRSFPNNIIHLDVASPRKIFSPSIGNLLSIEISTTFSHFKSHPLGCERCGRASTVPKYSTNETIPLTDLFDTFLIDFAGGLPMSREGNRHMLIADENLTNCPIAVPKNIATAAEVISFVNKMIN